MIAETPPRSPGAPVHSQNQAHSILIDHRRTLRPHRPDQIEPAFELFTEFPRARILNATAFKWHALQAGDAETRPSGTKQAEAIPAAQTGECLFAGAMIPVACRELALLPSANPGIV